MCELRSILKYADENSIVLGDEICKGIRRNLLPYLSYLRALKNYLHNNVNFILATHFHKLYDSCRRNAKNILQINLCFRTFINVNIMINTY